MHAGQRLVKSGAGSQTGPETFSVRSGSRDYLACLVVSLLHPDTVL